MLSSVNDSLKAAFHVSVNLTGMLSVCIQSLSSVKGFPVLYHSVVFVKVTEISKRCSKYLSSSKLIEVCSFNFARHFKTFMDVINLGHEEGSYLILSCSFLNCKPLLRLVSFTEDSASTYHMSVIH